MFIITNAETENAFDTGGLVATTDNKHWHRTEPTNKQKIQIKK